MRHARRIAIAALLLIASLVAVASVAAVASLAAVASVATVAGIATVGSVPAAPPRAATPARIVSTSPSITETLFALGLGDRVVGVSIYCRFPPQAATLPKVGTFLKPDAELIAGLRPDLVIIHEKSSGIDRRLSSLDIPFIVVEEGTLTSVFSSIRQIGTAAGVPDRAATLVADIQRTLEALRAKHAGRSRPRVLFIIGRRPGMLADLVATGPGTYLNDLIEIAGGSNVFASQPSSPAAHQSCRTDCVGANRLNIAGQPEYPRISMETVLRLDPDVIIDTVDMGDTAAERQQRQAFNERLWAAYGNLTAVRTKRLHAATTDALVVPGPRVVDAAEWIAALLEGTATR